MGEIKPSQGDQETEYKIEYEQIDVGKNQRVDGEGYCQAEQQAGGEVGQIGEKLQPKIFPSFRRLMAEQIIFLIQEPGVPYPQSRSRHRQRKYEEEQNSTD